MPGPSFGGNGVKTLAAGVTAVGGTVLGTGITTGTVSATIATAAAAAAPVVIPVAVAGAAVYGVVKFIKWLQED